MIPLYLSIEGMYSYREKQKIDFQELTKAGLFGIFGAVGSGKSTIIEAIIYVLFGRLERLNATKRYYNLMNLQSSVMEIEFHCVAKDQKTYIFKVSSKRHSKRFEEVKADVRMVYVLENGIKIPCESSNAEEILGMTYENFKRTVIIPQGMFREFLELKNTDRTDMMKQLFQLNAYDLSDKTKYLKSKTDEEKLILEGNLQSFANFTAELLKEKELHWKETELFLNQQQKIFEKIESQFQEVENFNKIQNEIHEKNNSLRNLLLKETEINERRNKVSNYKLVKTEFEFVLNQFMEFQQDLQKSQIDAKESEVNYTKIQNVYIKLTTQLKDVERDYTLLPQKRIVLQDYEAFLDIKSKQDEIQNLHQRLALGDEKFKILTQNVENSILEKSNLERNINELNAQKLDAELLFKIKDWWSAWDILIQNKSAIQNQMAVYQIEIAEVERTFSEKGFRIDNWKLIIGQQITEKEQEKEVLQRKENELLVHEEMIKFAQNLEKDAACPLCGSLEHPNPINSTSNSDELVKISRQKENVKKQLIDFNVQKEEFQKLESKFEFNLKNLNLYINQLLDMDSKMNLKSEEFNFEGFSMKNRSFFEEKYTLNFEIQRKLENYHKELFLIDAHIEKNRADKVKYDQTFEIIRQKITQCEISVKDNINKLQILTASKLDDFNIEQLDTLLKQTQLFVQDTELNRNQLLNTYAEVRANLAIAKTNLEHLNLRMIDNQTKIQVCEQQINEKLSTYGFENIAVVQQLLAQNLSISQIEQEIQLFEQQKNVLQVRLQELELQLKKYKWIDNEAADIKAQFVAIKQALDKAKVTAYEAKTTFWHVKNQLLEKEKIEKQWIDKKFRSENLQELSLLFHAKGFVQYISTQYLINLCETANRRFYKLTKQKLSLKIDENNDFVVIDHMNYDKERSIKTLSGGQFFQASLSLALALAESTRVLSQNEKSFFFIDEGFGTQDDESMEQIFETLSELQSENRIVGIISHVESLKERMPLSIQVQPHAEKGSRVSMIYR